MPERAMRLLKPLLAGVDWTDAPVDRLQLTAAPNMLPTALPIAPLAAAAIGAGGLIAATLQEMRDGHSQQVGVDLRAATLAMTSAPYLRVNGKPVKSWDPITGYYATRDGWVYLHGNFAHLRDGLLQLLGAPNDAGAVRDTVAGWSAADIEDAAGARGLCAVAVRNTETWTAHAQARATATLPLIEITRIGDAPPRPAGNGLRPLSGLRVLDLTRVIAGPMAGRTLAEHGATVMLASAPQLPSIKALVIDTGFGKHSVSVNLDTADGMATLRRLAGSADVFLNAYRPGALAGRGFSAETLAALRPGMVHVNISAFSRAGPWAGRRGYDTLVAAATGLTWNGGAAAPARLPCQPLDYLTGYLAAFGAMVALRRRALEGGSWQVSLSLERTAAWIRDTAAELGHEKNQPAQVPTESDIADLYAEAASPFGRLRYLRPVVQLAATPAGWDRPPLPLGTDPAQWPG